LRHVQALGGPAEVQLLGDGHEVAKLPIVEITHTARVSVARGSVLQCGARDPFT
jgi:hypothetical protein